MEKTSRHAPRELSSLMVKLNNNKKKKKKNDDKEQDIANTHLP